MAQQNREPDALTVTQAANLAKRTLESVNVIVEGEVSEVTDKRAYSAVYFTIKDENSCLPCKMWRNRYDRTGVRLRVGSLVLLSGCFTFYGKNGKFSFDAHHLQLSGEGTLRAKVAQVAEKLRAEGLMDIARKRPLPAFPQRIGLVTSPRGAAVRDVLRTLRRRYPLTEVLMCGVPVEGVNAPLQMAQALHVAANGGAEVILLVRGGGSFEDLMPFNDEKLAREVASCPVPVVTGIGHEPDNSICDMVADFRASTPTAAAETVAPEFDSIYAMLDQEAMRMTRFFSHKLEITRLYLERISEKPQFKDDTAMLGDRMATLDTQSERLHRAIPLAMAKDASRIESLAVHLRASAKGRFSQDENALTSLDARLRASLPLELQSDFQHLESHAARMHSCGQNLVAPYDAATRLVASRIHDLSPLAVLGRGYAMARDGEGSLVRRVAQVAPGDSLQVSVSDGTIDCTVDKTNKTSSDYYNEKEL